MSTAGWHHTTWVKTVQCIINCDFAYTGCVTHHSNKSSTVNWSLIPFVMYSHNEQMIHNDYFVISSVDNLRLLWHFWHLFSTPCKWCTTLVHFCLIRYGTDSSVFVHINITASSSCFKFVCNISWRCTLACDLVTVIWGHISISELIDIFATHAHR